jgi:DNA-binding MarR family transcriptional regulator
MLSSNQITPPKGHDVAEQTASTPARDELADAFITVSRALVGIAVRSVNAAPVEVTLVQHRLLVLLATGGDQTVGTLAEQLDVNASNASRLCDRLQRLGLVARDRSSRDGRAVDVSLTPAGRALLETVRTHRRDEVERVLSHLSQADVDAAIRALTAFGEAAHEIGEAQWTAYVL